MHEEPVINKLYKNNMAHIDDIFPHCHLKALIKMMKCRIEYSKTKD
jgi:hypothetical protein